ncbi:GMC family oxidoreductase [Haloarcula nitratireducens]|uniref:GMC family oxidoreductase n=1 Tax=Haloarcula nitratireducens TaxID=2487749 RepID=A0AAW4P8M0_9EURY|nr:GMC family oxidoreductase [Halomicroarcula nitratireducens]MBX0294270.1 GMC family oxidoreductase [Halomicroarcula nitratireducens]
MDREPAPRADVCVVGAGPAGALVASRLASDGHDVVVLEAGPRFDFSDRQERMEESIRPAHRGSVWEMGGQRDAFSASGERYYPLNVSRVKGVGGSTLHWQGMVMRLHPSDFEGSHDNGDPAWPIGYEDLRPYYADAETAMGVAGDADNPFAPPREEPYPMAGFPPSYSDSLFAEACESLGITMHGVPNARNSESYDGRGPCVGYGTCQPVCPSGAKYDASVHIEDAEEAGATVLDRVPVQRLETDGEGRVTAAVYATPNGTERRQEAREFVLAAGGVEIPRLLLLSKSESHPDGLANSSGAVGRYFMDHLFAGSGGVLGERTRQNHVGFITSECHQFYDDPGQAVERVADGETVVPASDARFSPIKLEFLNYAGPSPVELALSAENWGDELLGDLREAYGNSTAMGGLVGQPPKRENRVTLDTSTTDDHGNPVPDIQWSWGPRVKRSMARANDVQHAVLSELGVDIRWTAGSGNGGSGPAYHHMGTTRMGTDPEESVVNPQLRTHDVANLSIASSSVFVTAGSMNPTLTIAALALKCADHVEERL